MLRTRKLTLAGVAVGALALTAATSIPLAYGHGYTTAPISRAKHCANKTVSNCGQIQWEPQSTEGPKGFPGAGPADGKLCSAGLGQFNELNDQRGGAWPATQVSSGASFSFKWRLTAMHATTDFKYYVTKQGWNQGAPLSRSALDLNPFLTFPMNGARPAADVTHQGRLPNRTGRHMILAVWTIADTAMAFYQCSDVNFGSSLSKTGTDFEF
ncbi:lytic polysaccharide monooxygenase auxiliary activity family 9 protein [Kribbella sp. CA-293567]|uniref:lytic polysaccharide monooxygenase auxiliary activity family 9 protein n=1 Tax=Kribbella sp. CA-293567 TaxID=3002436 RepID=UPI0022DE081A|nr:lytic polysaccharide monooxygenase [Kribbella sp. CA-293567]WBQ03311.1 lytic polysaccharide monooxygenase [Kribbella sp. CA-293567]